MTLSRTRQQMIGGALGLSAAIVVAYGNSFWGPFVHLDLPAIVDNPTIRHWADWREVLNPPITGGVTVGGRPLINLTFALNYAWGGLNPIGYHVVNLLIHILAALTLFGVARRTLKPDQWWLAWAGALIWAVHPLQTESVTYVVQRAESLMGLFYLLEFYCFIRAAHSGRSVGTALWTAASVVGCLFGMATKEVMVSAPLMVLLYDSAFLSGSWREALRQRGWIHAARFATWIPLAALVIHTGGRGGTAGFGLGISWWTYVRTQFGSIVHYVRMAFWPAGQIFYAAPNFHSPRSEVWVCGLAVGALAAAIVIAWWRAPRCAFLGTFFFAILSPTSLIPGITQTMAEHRMYLALAPIVLGVAAILGVQVRSKGWVMGVLGVWAAALMALTFARNRVYRSSEALWADTAARSVNNPYAQNNLGIALAEAGHPAQAAACFAAAIAAKPAYPEAENNWGLAESSLGRIEAAEAHYRKALQLRADYPEAHANLGVILARRQRPAEAEREFREAVRLNPDYAEARNNLAVTLAQTGHLPEAVEEYEKTVRARPGNADGRFNYANALVMLGRNREAIEQYRAVLRLRPSHAEASANLGAALAQDGQMAAAVQQYDAAVRLAPHDPDLHYNLALALRALGRGGEANAELNEAKRLRALPPARPGGP
jgi:tetratricopeptide (TPR) repeat protein